MPTGVLGAPRAVAALVVLVRLAASAKRCAPISAGYASPATAISVVIPARDEAGRLGPLLEAVRDAPGVGEVIVVDDESTDATAALARSSGVRVIAGSARPTGWAGKSWALRQGVEAAAGEWVVTLDADTRPDPRLPAAAVARAIADGADLLTLAGRFDCPTRGARWLHASMLTTLVYRFGPPGAARRPRVGRLLANGQCMVARRSVLLGPTGIDAVASEVVEDIALARTLARTGSRVDFLDAGSLLTVRAYDDFASTLTGWGRSLSLPGVESRWRRLLDAAVLVATMPLPLARCVAGRADVVDVAMIATRIGTLVGARTAYRVRDAAYWLSPLADPIAAGALAAGAARSSHRWRGRDYQLT